MSPNKALLILGVSAVVIGAGASIILPSLPSAIQSNATLQPIGTWFIDNGNNVALFAALVILIAAFIPLG